MSQITEIECDGCARRTRASVDNAGLPPGWRRLRVIFGRASWTLDVCSAYCASKAVDSTYEKDDRHDAIKAGLHIVSADSGQ